MPPLLKIASIGGVCAGALGCFWLITHIHGMPPYRDLFSDNDFEIGSGKTYNNKYASDYSKYFVGVSDTAKEGSQSSGINNDSWWDWSFKNRYKTSNSSDIKQGFKEKTSGDQLKEACKLAYQSTKDKVKDNASNTDEYDESNVWIFCSIGGNKPTTIYLRVNEKDSYGEGTYGKTEANNKLLISTKDNNNDWFWNIKEFEFFSPQSFPGNSSDSSSEFKKLHDDRAKYMDFKHRKVKELCELAYNQKPTESSTTYPKNDVFKFCSLKGKESS